MSLRSRLGLAGLHWPTVLLTFALGLAGGWLAQLAGLPLPMLTGSLIAVGGAALAGLRPLGHLPQMPQSLRMVFVPAIGVSIGAAFTPQILAEARQWWPSLVALALFIPAVHWIGYRALTATGRTDRVTAYFGTVPGGLIESVQMGEEMGADLRMLTMLQFMRLILTIILVPLFFTWMTGHAVGSAGGAVIGGTGLPLAARDMAILVAAGILGAVLGKAARLPAGIISGPILLSGLVHLAGWTQTAPPGWLIGLTQVAIGTTLGVRFAGMPPGQFVTAARLSSLHVALTIAAAAAVAFLLGPPVGEPPAAVFLAFAPGGLAEMSLIALSLDMSVVYVTVHHVARIVLAVTFARAFAGRLRR